MTHVTYSFKRIRGSHTHNHNYDEYHKIVKKDGLWRRGKLYKDSQTPRAAFIQRDIAGELIKIAIV